MPFDQESSEPLQRKLTTILAADVVGYSLKMSVDEDNTHKRLGRCRKITDSNIEHHGGRIFNTAGDSVMAEFGSTVEAVRCAIQIQDEIGAHNSGKPESEQMWFRIGLNVGDVIIDGDDLIGDGVNIASRMESIAKPGGISISGSVYELVHNKLSFIFEDMGAQSVKNIVEPIPTYSLLPAATPKIITSSSKGRSSAPQAAKSSPNKALPVLLVLIILVVTAVLFFTKESGDLKMVEQPVKTPIKESSQKLIAKPAPEQKPVAVIQPTPVQKPEPKKEPDTPSTTSEPAVVVDELPVIQARITPSFFEGRSIEGVSRTTGRRFVIEVTPLGSAVVTVYKEDAPSERRGTDSGRWWINKEDRICFEFKKFSKGTKFCRIYSVEDGQELLVSGNPAKPKWMLHPK